ncbi:MAG: type II toxin-antitoxin system HicB family antitoxin [Thermodesulfovibrionales bacterium]
MLIKIDTYFDGEYWCARGVNEDIFTQGTTYDELLKNIKEVVSLHLEDELKKGKTAEILVMSEIEVSGVA